MNYYCWMFPNCGTIYTYMLIVTADLVSIVYVVDNICYTAQCTHLTSGWKMHVLLFFFRRLLQKYIFLWINDEGQCRPMSCLQKHTIAQEQWMSQDALLSLYLSLSAYFTCSTVSFLYIFTNLRCQVAAITILGKSRTASTVQIWSGFKQRRRLL